MFVILHQIAATLNPNTYQTDLPQVDAGNSQLHDILTLVFGILAAVAVLFIVIGGFRYVLSNGDPQEASKARSTVLYAVVGLIISLAAQAIVTFAIKKV